MKFLRHLAAVLVLVASAAAAGVGWEHSGAASWIAVPYGSGPGGPGGHGVGYRQTVNGPVLIAGRAVPAGKIKIVRLGGAPVELSNLRDVGRTAEIEAGVMAGVVVLSVIRRRRRRVLRAPP